MAVLFRVLSTVNLWHSCGGSPERASRMTGDIRSAFGAVGVADYAAGIMYFVFIAAWQRRTAARRQLCWSNLTTTANTRVLKLCFASSTLSPSIRASRSDTLEQIDYANTAQEKFLEVRDAANTLL